MNKHILTIALLGILLAGCQPFEEIISEVIPEGKVTLTVQASKEIPGTKALFLDGNTLDAYWKDGEKVDVFLDGTWMGTLEARTDGSSKPGTAMLEGTLDNTSGLVAGSVLTLLFPGRTGHDWDYTGQDGSAPDEAGSLATQYDYALATVTIRSVSGNSVTTTGSAAFENQQSIYRFGFKIGGSGDNIAIRSVAVASAHDALVKARSWSGSAWSDTPGLISATVAGDGSLTLPYLSLRNTLVSADNAQKAENTTIDTYSFYVVGGTDNALYVGEKPIPAKVMDTQGKFISATSISVAKSDLSQPGTVSEVW